MESKPLLLCLLLSSLLLVRPVKGERRTPSDFLVSGLEDIEPAFASFPGRMYAGLLPTVAPDDTHRTEGRLMFWLFEPDSCSIPDSIVLWLNGGPFCSSFGGAFFENSPVTVPHYEAGYFGTKANEPLVPNAFSWTNATTMLYLEQPHGTGFSSGPIPKDEADVSRDMFNFLQNFFNMFTNLRHKRFFIFGESYAGMHVTSFAHKIHQENKKGKHASINLAGIGLGNGWVDATVQGPVVIDYAWYHGLIDSITRDALHAQWESCVKRKPQPGPFHDFTTPDECGIVSAVVSAAGAGTVAGGGPNIYDVTTWDVYPFIFDLNGTQHRFFNNPKIQDMIHAPRIQWRQCIPGEGRRRLNKGHRPSLPLDDDKPVSTTPYIAELLDDAGIHVLVYNGDRDLSTSYAGSEIVLDNMEWSGKSDWHDPYKTRRGLWMVDGQVAGYSRFLKGLEFVMVYNSGHLVPINQPRRALDLATRVLKGKRFADVELPVFAPPKKSSRHGATEKGCHEKNRTFIVLVAFIAAVFGFFAGITFVHGRSRFRLQGYTHIQSP